MRLLPHPIDVLLRLGVLDISRFPRLDERPDPVEELLDEHANALALLLGALAVVRVELLPLDLALEGLLLRRGLLFGGGGNTGSEGRGGRGAGGGGGEEGGGGRGGPFGRDARGVGEGRSRGGGGRSWRRGGGGWEGGLEGGVGDGARGCGPDRGCGGRAGRRGVGSQHVGLEAVEGLEGGA